MSILINNTLATPTTSFYAALGGGGGGGGSTLASPASITPDLSGNVLLSLNAIATPSSGAATGATVSVVSNVTGGSGATVLVSDTTGNDAIVQMLNTAGGNSTVIMGTAAAPVGMSAPSLAAAGQINLGVVNVANGSVPVPVVKIDTANNVVDVANPLAAASVFLNGQTFVTSSASRPPANAIVLSNTSGTASAITQQVASGGTLTIGSSLAAPANITVTDTAVNIVGLGGAIQTLLNQTNVLPAVTIPGIPAPTGEGLYAIVGCSVPVSTAYSRAAQFSVICYVNSAGQVQMGGSGTSDVGGVGGTDVVTFQPADGTTTFVFINGGLTQINNFSIRAFKLSGPIPNAF